MPATRLTERLDQHQQAILDILREAEAMLTDPGTHDIAGLARARWALMRALTAYQLLMQGEVIEPAIGRKAPRAERMKQAGIAAVEAFRGNVTKWSGADVAAVWPEYQASALAMIARLREHVTKQRHEIESLLKAA